MNLNNRLKTNMAIHVVAYSISQDFNISTMAVYF